MIVEWELQNHDPPQRHQLNTNIQSKRLYAHLKSYSKRKATHHIKENVHKIVRGLQSRRTSLVAQTVKNLPSMQETWVQSLGREDPLEKELEPTPAFFSGKSHGQRSLWDYSPWGSQRVTHN